MSKRLPTAEDVRGILPLPDDMIPEWAIERAEATVDAYDAQWADGYSTAAMDSTPVPLIARALVEAYQRGAAEAESQAAIWQATADRQAGEILRVRAAVAEIAMLSERITALRAAIVDAIKFLEASVDTWMDRETNEKLIAKLRQVISG